MRCRCAGVGVLTFHIDIEFAVARIGPDGPTFSVCLANRGSRRPVRASVDVFQHRFLGGFAWRVSAAESAAGGPSVGRNSRTAPSASCLAPALPAVRAAPLGACALALASSAAFRAASAVLISVTVGRLSRPGSLRLSRSPRGGLRVGGFLLLRGGGRGQKQEHSQNDQTVCQDVWLMFLSRRTLLFWP